MSSDPAEVKRRATKTLQKDLCRYLNFKLNGAATCEHMQCDDIEIKAYCDVDNNHFVNLTGEPVSTSSVLQSVDGQKTGESLNNDSNDISQQVDSKSREYVLCAAIEDVNKFTELIQEPVVYGVPNSNHPTHYEVVFNDITKSIDRAGEDDDFSCSNEVQSVDKSKTSADIEMYEFSVAEDNDDLGQPKIISTASVRKCTVVDIQECPDLTIENNTEATDFDQQNMNYKFGLTNTIVPDPKYPTSFCLQQSFANNLSDVPPSEGLVALNPCINSEIPHSDAAPLLDSSISLLKNSKKMKLTAPVQTSNEFFADKSVYVRDWVQGACQITNDNEIVDLLTDAFNIPDDSMLADAYKLIMESSDFLNLSPNDETMTNTNFCDTQFLDKRNQSLPDLINDCDFVLEYEMDNVQPLDLTKKQTTPTSTDSGFTEDQLDENGNVSRLCCKKDQAFSYPAFNKNFGSRDNFKVQTSEDKLDENGNSSRLCYISEDKSAQNENVFYTRDKSHCTATNILSEVSSFRSHCSQQDINKMTHDTDSTFRGGSLNNLVIPPSKQISVISSMDIAMDIKPPPIANNSVGQSSKLASSMYSNKWQDDMNYETHLDFEPDESMDEDESNQEDVVVQNSLNNEFISVPATLTNNNFEATVSSNVQPSSIRDCKYVANSSYNNQLIQSDQSMPLVMKKAPTECREKLIIKLSNNGSRVVTSSLSLHQRQFSRILKALFKQPCFKILNNQGCTSSCRFNHSPPPAEKILPEMLLLQNDMISCVYSNFVKKGRIYFNTYFKMMCEAFGRRKMESALIEAIADCENYYQTPFFKYIFNGLTQSGLSKGDAMIKLITHCNQSVASYTKLIEIMIDTNARYFANVLNACYHRGNIIEFIYKLLKQIKANPAPNLLQLFIDILAEYKTSNMCDLGVLQNLARSIQDYVYRTGNSQLFNRLYAINDFKQR